MIAEQPVSEIWRNHISEWLVRSGCLYFIAWGVDCEAWHDSVDWAVLETHNFNDIPDDKFVMTTWHDKEPLSEALWLLGNCASHPDVELDKTIILHLAEDQQRVGILQAFRIAQETTDI